MTLLALAALAGTFYLWRRASADRPVFPSLLASEFAILDDARFERKLIRLAQHMAAGYGPGNRHRLDYTTPRGSHFTFSLERSAGSWCAYIERQPSYGGRAEDSHTSHRLTGTSGRRYVCWAGPSARLEQIVHVAVRWAHFTERYIATGRGF